MRPININDLFGNDHSHACMHDSYVDRITLDHVARTAEFECRICEGDSEEIDARELWTPGRLKFTGVLFFCAQVPDETYPYEDTPLDVTSHVPWTAELGKSIGIKIPADLPEDAFAQYFYINNWNRGLVIAATRVEFEWL